MYPKLQSKGLAGGPNTGSCASYAYYLEHENRWKKKKGQKDKLLPFFDKNRKIVPMSTVIKKIDSNKAGLHTEDAKFFSLGSRVSRPRMYANGSPRYEARETCPDAILYHKVSTLEPHPTGFPVYVSSV